MTRSAAVEVLADVVGWSGLPEWEPDWSVTERLLGLALPDDYKALVSSLPVGKYAGTVIINRPVSKKYESDLLALFREAMIRLTDGRNHPYPAYPALPGLIPWGQFSHPMGGTLLWLADQGDPNSWPVVAWGADGTWEEYDVGAVAFLIALVRGRIPSEVVTPKPGAPAFRAYQDMAEASKNTRL